MLKKNLEKNTRHWLKIFDHFNKVGRKIIIDFFCCATQNKTIDMINLVEFFSYQSNCTVNFKRIDNGSHAMTISSISKK